MTSAPRAWLALIRELFSPHLEYRAITRRDDGRAMAIAIESAHRGRDRRDERAAGPEEREQAEPGGFRGALREG